MLDIFLKDSFFGFQFGLGPYFGIGDNKTARFGLTFGPGVYIRVTESFQIPILMRFDVIIAERTLIPVNVWTGLSYRFF